MDEWYEVLKDGVVKDSENTTYNTGDALVIDENKTNELLKTIEEYEQAGDMEIRQGFRPPRFFQVAPAKPAQKP